MPQEFQCSNCAFHLTELTLFCPNCGALLTPAGGGQEARKGTLGKGDTFAGRYEIIDILGQGGMGIVYKAVDRERREILALKTISEEALARPNVNPKIYRGRFLREAKAISKVQHPNIVQVYEVGEFEGQSFITMEYLKGRTLEDIICDDGPVDPNLAKKYALQAAEALAHIHECGIIHRDMKPLNIMILDNGTVKLMDFGLVKMTGAEMQQTFTRTGQIVGTPQYLAPEVIQGAVIDYRSDIFSFGTVLYEMTTGTNPFDTNNIASTLQRILDVIPPAPGDLRAGVPATLDFVTMKCLQKDPIERYQSMGGVVEDLKKPDSAFETTQKLRIRLGDSSRIRLDKPQVAHARLHEVASEAEISRENGDTQKDFQEKLKSMVELGKKSMKRGNYKLALQFLNRVLDQTKEIEESWTMKIECLCLLEKWDDVDTFLHRARLLFPRSVELKSQAALLALRKRDRGTCTALMNDVTQGPVGSPFAYLCLGELALPEDPEAANLYFEKALELRPQSWFFAYWAGRAHFACDRYSDSFRYLHRAHSEAPGHASILKSLGLISLAKGQVEDAEDFLSRSVSLNPQNLEAAEALEGLRKRGKGLFKRTPERFSKE